MVDFIKYCILKKIVIGLFFVSISLVLTAQNEETSSEKINNFTGVVTIQNKGISTVPNLTLGDPAIIFDMKMGRKLTFEPQFRFSLKDGKPWAMVFWWRYYGTFSDKFKVTTHTNHSLSYKSIKLFNVDGTERDVTRTNRYLAGAASPNYQINKYIGIGSYLFYARGLDSNMTKNTYMVSLRPTFSNLPIFKNIVARIAPEVYYLRMDNKGGVFFNSRFLISKNNSPLSISGLVNKPIKSNIPSEFDFLWNVGISYTFNKKYIEKR